MNLAEWRALQSEGDDATLPSGLTVKLRRVGVMDLAERGQIPQTLAPQLEAYMSGGKKVTLAQFNEQAEVINLVCQACIVAPADLGVEELPFADRLAIFQWANEVNQPLTSFRAKQNGAVETAFTVG